MRPPFSVLLSAGLTLFALNSIRVAVRESLDADHHVLQPAMEQLMVPARRPWTADTNTPSGSSMVELQDQQDQQQREEQEQQPQQQQQREEQEQQEQQQQQLQQQLQQQDAEQPQQQLLLRRGLEGQQGVSPKLFKDAEDPQKQIDRQAVSLPTIDILSIGSYLKHRKSMQQAQVDTFGSHKAVRYIYRGTERDDSDSCHLRLTLPSVARVARFCRNQTTKAAYPVLYEMAPHYIQPIELRRKPQPAGWLCAQKRPFDSFMHMIGQYQYRRYQLSTTTKTTTSNYTNDSYSYLPDYLVVMDDDTWINIDNMLEFLPRHYPSHRPHVVAGCMLITQSFPFTLPFGGYGIIFSKLALERLLQPLYCGSALRSTFVNKNDLPLDTSDPWISEGQRNRNEKSTNDDAFERLACWRLKQDGIGERDLFQDGMSIVDLLQEYASAQSFIQVKRWHENSPGFCMHSDWAWAYFVNYYHIAQPAPRSHFVQYNILSSQTASSADLRLAEVPMMHDRLVGYNDSQVRPWAGPAPKWALSRQLRQLRMKQCNNGRDLFMIKGMRRKGMDFCNNDAHVCHRVKGARMRWLHMWNQARYPQHYYDHE